MHTPSASHVIASDRRVSYVVAPPPAAEGNVYQLSALERVRLVKQGVPARAVQELSLAMGLPREQFMRAAGLARSTVERKIAARGLLSESESEKMVGISRLIGQIEAMAQPVDADFSAPRWFASWISQPVAALGGLCPQELLGTADGREALSNLLLQMQFGVYA